MLVTYGSWGNSSLLLFYFNVALCYRSGSVMMFILVPMRTNRVQALIVLLDLVRMISVLVALPILFSSSRSSIPQFEYSVWSSNSGGFWPVAWATLTTASLIPTSSHNFNSDRLFFTLFQTLSSISISPSFNASKIVSSVLVPIVSGTSLLKGVWSSATKVTQSELYEILGIWRLYST